MKINYFNSIIVVIRTIKNNGLTNWKMLSATGLRKIGSSISVVKIANSDGFELRGIKWYNNTATSLVTTYKAIDPIKKRWNRLNKLE